MKKINTMTQEKFSELQKTMTTYDVVWHLIKTNDPSIKVTKRGPKKTIEVIDMAGNTICRHKNFK